MNQIITNESSTRKSIDNAAEKLVQQLRDSPPKVTKLGNNPIPKQDAIVETLDLLKRVLFPGYRETDGQDFSDINSFVNSLLTTLHQRLTDHIAQALILTECVGRRNCDEVQFDEITALSPCAKTMTAAETLATEFLQSLHAIRKTLGLDVQAALSGDPACKNLFEVILCYPGFHAITIYRLAHRLHELGVPLVPRMMTEWVHGETGIDIHPGATIGDYFFIDHGTGVVIGETCVIGQYVKLYQGVTLGAVSFPHDHRGELIRDTRRHPTIEDRVVIYANATILGGETVVGHDSIIGSSVWLTNSVEPNTTVTMEKPKLRMRNLQRSQQ